MTEHQPVKRVRTGKSEQDAVQGHFNLMRELVQKVVVAPSPDGKSADLTIHGRLASILASMKAFQDYSKAMRADFTDDYARRVRAGELKGQKQCDLREIEALFLARGKRIKPRGFLAAGLVVNVGCGGRI